jgi:hypothetical protein
MNELVGIDAFRIGDRVLVTARSEWCEFIDGMRGVIERFDGGMAVVKVFDEDMEKYFYVPTDELALTI